MNKRLIDMPEFASVGIKLSATENQKQMVHRIRNNTLTFVYGPAGCGKTHISIAEGLRSLLDPRNKRTKRFYFIRPAVPAFEDLGYLPGDLDEKTEPYMMPFYHSLKKLLNGSSGRASGKIEVMTMAYIRGLTFEYCYVVLDEAQNTTVDQMKLFLSRIGKGCKVVVIGDANQPDIKTKNGLEDAISRFRSIPGISVHQLTHADNMRSPIVDKILKLYEGIPIEEVYPEFEEDEEIRPIKWGDVRY